MPGTVASEVRGPIDTCSRSVDQVHDDELTLALTNLARDTGGLGRDELSANVAKLYGWTRRGSDISRRLDLLIDRLIANGVLVSNGLSLSLRVQTP